MKTIDKEEKRYKKNDRAYQIISHNGFLDFFKIMFFRITGYCSCFCHSGLYKVLDFVMLLFVVFYQVVNPTKARLVCMLSKRHTEAISILTQQCMCIYLPIYKYISKILVLYKCSQKILCLLCFSISCPIYYMP